MRFSGKVIVVTGGASGIGLATVKRLAAEGAHIVIADKNGQDAESAAADLRKMVRRLHWRDGVTSRLMRRSRRQWTPQSRTMVWSAR